VSILRRNNAGTIAVVDRGVSLEAGGRASLSEALSIRGRGDLRSTESRADGRIAYEAVLGRVDDDYRAPFHDERAAEELLDWLADIGTLRTLVTARFKFSAETHDCIVPLPLPVPRGSRSAFSEANGVSLVKYENERTDGRVLWSASVKRLGDALQTEVEFRVDLLDQSQNSTEQIAGSVMDAASIAVLAMKPREASITAEHPVPVEPQATSDQPGPSA
jgi:hypothetical protein